MDPKIGFVVDPQGNVRDVRGHEPANEAAKPTANAPNHAKSGSIFRWTLIAFVIFVAPAVVILTYVLWGFSSGHDATGTFVVSHNAGLMLFAQVALPAVTLGGVYVAWKASRCRAGTLLEREKETVIPLSWVASSVTLLLWVVVLLVPWDKGSLKISNNLLEYRVGDRHSYYPLPGNFSVPLAEVEEISIYHRRIGRADQHWIEVRRRGQSTEKHIVGDLWTINQGAITRELKKRGFRVVNDRGPVD